MTSYYTAALLLGAILVVVCTEKGKFIKAFPVVHVYISTILLSVLQIQQMAVQLSIVFTIEKTVKTMSAITLLIIIIT